MTANVDIRYFDIEELGTFPLSSHKIQITEGELKLTQHLTRERNTKIVKLAKELFRSRNNGRLFCEVCGFSFSATYGEIGTDYIEAHHKHPISKMEPGHVTHVSDFIMVCSNCHSMLHIGTEWISHEELRDRLNKHS